jgi:hypothetical protein
MSIKVSMSTTTKSHRSWIRWFVIYTELFDTLGKLIGSVDNLL